MLTWVPCGVIIDAFRMAYGFCRIGQNTELLVCGGHAEHYAIGFQSADPGIGGMDGSSTYRQVFKAGGAY